MVYDLPRGRHSLWQRMSTCCLATCQTQPSLTRLWLMPLRSPMTERASLATWATYGALRPRRLSPPSSHSYLSSLARSQAAGEF